MAKRSKSKEDEMLRQIFSGSGALSEENSKFAHKVLLMAHKAGLEKTKIIGGGDNEVEVETDFFDAIKFLEYRIAALNKGVPLNKKISSIRSYIDSIEIPEKIKKASKSNPYRKQVGGNSSMPWATRQHLEKKYPKQLAAFRASLNSPTLPIPSIRTGTDPVVIRDYPEVGSGAYNQLRAKILSSGKPNRHPFVSGGLSATDFDASRLIVERKLAMLDRLRDFRNATNSSGFGRYVSAERVSNDLIDKNNAEQNEIIANRKAAESRGSIRNRRERIQMMKEFPSFFKNSKRTSKDVHDLVRGMRRLERIPFIGKTMTSAAKHPAIAAIIGSNIIGSLLEKSDVSNAKVTDWSNATNLYGTPSKRFTEAAYKAGYKDPGQIAKLYGQLTLKYGNADTFLESIGSSIGNVDGMARIALAKELGLDEAGMALVDIFSGNGRIKMSSARETNANKNMVEAMKTMGYSSSGSWGDMLESLWLSIPGIASGRARDMRDFDYVNAASKNAYYDKFNKANELAASDAAYESQRVNNIEAVTGSSTDSHNVSVTINADVKATGDGATIAKELTTRGMEEARVVAESFDQKKR